MTKEERVLRVINGQDVDYLPSQITFSDRTRDAEITAALGIGPDELDDYLKNHIHITLSAHDKPLFYRNDRGAITELEANDFCCADWDNNVVYDSWGMGITVGSDGFFSCFHPLSKTATPEVAEHMPPDVNRETLFQDVDEAVANYDTPDMNRPGLFDEMKKDVDELSGDFLVMASGYCGTFERSYALMSFQQLMMNMVANPRAVHDLMDKVTEYRIEFAKKVVELGFKVAHHGDDLGTQSSVLFSGDMFHEFLLPRLKLAWQPYNDAGIPIIMHSCGNITKFIPDLIDIGLRVLEPVQPCMDLEYIKREFGKDLVFWGGIETQNLLPFGTPQQVKEMARETIRTLGKGGGHIIGPSQEIMNDVPIENIKALVETIVEERQTVLDL